MKVVFYHNTVLLIIFDDSKMDTHIKKIKNMKYKI